MPKVKGLIAQNISSHEFLGSNSHTFANEFLKNGNKTIVASDLLSKISSSLLYSIILINTTKISIYLYVK